MEEVTSNISDEFKIGVKQGIQQEKEEEIRR